MRNWIRDDPARFYAIWLGVVVPPVIWFVAVWTGTPHPQQPLLFVVGWILFGILIGGLTYAISRFLGSRAGPG